jgi:hypothetical protein
MKIKVILLYRRIYMKIKRVLVYSLTLCIMAMSIFGFNKRVLAANFLTNGNFQSGTYPWTLSLSSATATLSNSSGWGYVNISNGGSSKSSVQLMQTFSTNLVSETTYEISFDAKAVAGKSFDVVIRDSSNNIIWSKYSLAAGIDSQHYSYTFTPSSDYSGAKLAFRIGSDTTGFYCDNVVVQPTSNKLTWAPPVLENPITIYLNAVAEKPTLTEGQDYILVYPNTPKVGALDISGGRNIVIKGGTSYLAYADHNDYAIRISRTTTGTVHIEGLLCVGSRYIDGVWTEKEGDFLNISAPNTIVQVENCRVENLSGGYTRPPHNHADIIQPWGGVKELRVDRLTADSNYQGLQLNADYNTSGSMTFKNVNIKSDPPIENNKGGHMIWLDTTRKFPVSFSNVYVQPRADRTMFNSLWPQTVTYNSTNNLYSWPTETYILGGIYQGPPAKDFVPSGTVGIGYVSPGYVN